MELKGTYYLALFREDDIEVSGSGYKRISVEFDSNTNPVRVEFGPIKKDWGRIIYIGLMDALNGGNCLAKIFVRNAEVGDKINCSCPPRLEIGGR